MIKAQAYTECSDAAHVLSSDCPRCRQTADEFARSNFTLYDDHFRVLNTPVSNFPGRLSLLETLPDPTPGATGSFIAAGGSMFLDPTSGRSCLFDARCLSISFVYADFNTPAGFNAQGIDGRVYTHLVCFFEGSVHACVSVYIFARVQMCVRACVR
jgi:hypothetical protein